MWDMDGRGKKLRGAMEHCRGMRLKVHGDMETTRSKKKAREHETRDETTKG